MKERHISVFNCDHCNKLYQVRNACERHEKLCNKNPINFRACHFCEHLDKKETTIYHDTGYGEMTSKVSLLYCKAKDIFLYPPKVEAKGEWFETDPENVPMPKECDMRKSTFIELI